FREKKFWVCLYLMLPAHPNIHHANLNIYTIQTYNCHQLPKNQYDFAYLVNRLDQRWFEGITFSACFIKLTNQFSDI
ncbi:hypothetical protein ACLHZV_06875, partial [Aeromonas salmonicida]|uniref:hypothetical protein n=1 Tax=Aeromonas salmonicida TaxID=645 RepID=UPI003CFCCC71